MNKIFVDIDRDRIREIVTEALRMIHEYLGGNFHRSKEEVLEQLNIIISSNKVTTQFFLEIGSDKIPDLVLRVDPVRKKVLCKSSFKKKVAKINNLMRIL
jgi:hypothetical protein